MHRTAGLAISFFVLSACATPYSPMGYAGGYESNWLAPDYLSVTVLGNGFTDSGRVRDYALLQAAERARESRYCYFVFVESMNRSSRETTYVPGATTTTTTGTYTPNTFNATSTTTGGGFYMPVFRPGESLIVRMFGERPAGYRPGQYYDVAEIIQTVGSRYLNPQRQAMPLVCNSTGTPSGGVAKP